MDDRHTRDALDGLASLFLTGSGGARAPKPPQASPATAKPGPARAALPRPAADPLSGPPSMRLPPKVAEQFLGRGQPARAALPGGIHGAPRPPGPPAARPALKLAESDPASRRQPPGPPREPRTPALVEAVFLGNLPGFGGPWLAQYANDIALREGPVALLHVDLDRIDVELVMPRDAQAEQARAQPVSRVGTARDDADEGKDARDEFAHTPSTGGHVPPLLATLESLRRLQPVPVRRWMLHVVAPEEPAQAARIAGLAQWTLVTGADEAAVVAGYRLVKQVSDTLGARQWEGPRKVGLAVMGSDEAVAQQAARHLADAARQHLGLAVDLMVVRKRMAPVKVVGKGGWNLDDPRDNGHRLGWEDVQVFLAGLAEPQVPTGRKASRAGGLQGDPLAGGTRDSEAPEFSKEALEALEREDRDDWAMAESPLAALLTTDELAALRGEAGRPAQIQVYEADEPEADLLDPADRVDDDADGAEAEDIHDARAQPRGAALNQSGDGRQARRPMTAPHQDHEASAESRSFDAAGEGGPGVAHEDSSAHEPQSGPEATSEDAEDADEAASLLRRAAEEALEQGVIRRRPPRGAKASEGAGLASPEQDGFEGQDTSSASIPPGDRTPGRRHAWGDLGADPGLDAAPAAPALTSLVDPQAVRGAMALEVRCPKQPDIELALDEEGRLHLLHRHDPGNGRAGLGKRPGSPAVDAAHTAATGLRVALAELLEARLWASQHLALLRLARRQCVFADAEPAIHLFTPDSRAASGLAARVGAVVRLHLLLREGRGWRSLPLFED